MKAVATAIVLSAALTGCATATYNYAPEAESFSVPEVGETASRMVGERMLIQGVATEREVIKVETPQRIGAYRINPGTYLKVGSEPGYSHYASTGGNGYITQGLFNTPALGMSIRVSDVGESCVVGAMNFMACGNLNYQEVTQAVEGESNFQQTLIYSGKVGEVITLSYREFTGGMARDAFTNRVDYDLTQSDIVSYQGARLRILEADNSSITYEVLSPFYN